MSQGEFGVASIDGIAGEAGIFAQIFTPRTTETALPTGPIHPWYADAITLLEMLHLLSRFNDPPDDLMAGHEWKLRMSQFAIQNVEIGPADAAGMDPNEYLIFTGLRPRQLRRCKA